MMYHPAATLTLNVRKKRATSCRNQQGAFPRGLKLLASFCVVLYICEIYNIIKMFLFLDII